MTPCEADECHADAASAVTFRGEVLVVACGEHLRGLIDVAGDIWGGPFEIVELVRATA